MESKNNLRIRSLLFTERAKSNNYTLKARLFIFGLFFGVVVGYSLSYLNDWWHVKDLRENIIADRRRIDIAVSSADFWIYRYLEEAGYHKIYSLVAEQGKSGQESRVLRFHAESAVGIDPHREAMLSNTIKAYKKMAASDLELNVETSLRTVDSVKIEITITLQE